MAEGTAGDSPATITDEHRAQIEAWLKAHPYGDQDEYGIDLGSLRRNLALTPTERLIRLQATAHAIQKLKNGMPKRG